MSKPRPIIVTQIEIAIALGKKATPGTLQLLEYIKQLEAEAAQRDAALAYLSGVVGSCCAVSATERTKVLETSRMLACGTDERIH